MGRIFVRNITYLFVLLGLSTSAGLWAGTYFEATSTARNADKKKATSTTLVHAWIDGLKAKVLFIDGDEGMMKDGSYLLTPDGGETLFLVNPKEESYFRWTIDGMFTMMSATLQGMGPLFEMDLSDPKFKELGEEPGGTLLGHATRKVTTLTGFTMDMKVMGIKRHAEIETVQEAWIAQGLDDLGFGVWLRRKPPSTGDAEFDELMLEGWNARQGFPLKSVATTNSTNKKGKTETTISQMTVDVLRDESIPASTFEIPEGYEEVEMPALAAEGGDSASDGESEEESGGKNPFKRFGFGKKKDS